MEDAALEVVQSDATLQAAAQQVLVYLRNTRAANTTKAYAADWMDFETWCAAHGLAALPASAPTVMLYLGQLGAAGKKPSTIARRLAALACVHRAAGQESPTEAPPVGDVLAGIRRTQGVAGAGKEALLSDDLRAIVRELGDSLRDVRDRALLLVGFAGAFRRSELIALQVGDVEAVAEGMVIKIRRSKSDQQGQGREVPIPFGSRAETCPVAALRAWLSRAGVDSGPVFRAVSRHGAVAAKALTPTAVALIVKERAGAAGLDQRAYSGHSLRAGFATSAALGGAPEWAIMKQTGHRSRAMLDRYVRVASRFRNNAASFVGL